MARGCAYLNVAPTSTPSEGTCRTCRPRNAGLAFECAYRPVFRGLLAHGEWRGGYPAPAHAGLRAAWSPGQGLLGDLPDSTGGAGSARGASFSEHTPFPLSRCAVGLSPAP